MNGPIWRKYPASGASGIAWLPFLATTGQVTRQLLGPTFAAVDIRVDRLVADENWLLIEIKTPGNLLWRPSDLQLSNDVSTQTIKADQFASTHASVRRILLRIHPVVAV